MARSLLYADLRYEGDPHGVTGVDEPDLILTDNLSLSRARTGQNEDVAYMGLLSALLAWQRRGVDAFERRPTWCSFRATATLRRSPRVGRLPVERTCGGGGGGGSAPTTQ